MPSTFVRKRLAVSIGGTSGLSPQERPTVRVGSTTYLLFLSVIPQDEWRLPDLPERKLDGLNNQEKELTHNSLRSGWKTIPRRLAKQVPLVTDLKPGTMTSAPALGLPDLAQPFTLYLTEKDKVAMGVLSQIMGT